MNNNYFEFLARTEIKKSYLLIYSGRHIYLYTNE